MKKSVFKWMYWIHGWLGLILGVFLTVLGITGSLLAFLPELEVAEAPKLMAVKPSEGWISPGKVLTEVARAYPDYRLFLLVLPIEQTMPYRVYVADSKGELFRASVNEYTGEILGLLPEAKRSTAWLGNLHTTFFLGPWGYVIGAIFSITLVISAVTGFYVHLKIIRGMFQKTRGKKGLRLLFSDWHRLISLASLVLTLVLAVTAVYLGFSRFSAATHPQKAPPAASGQAHMVLPPLSIETYLNAAAEVFPQKRPEVIVFSPAPGGPLAIETREHERKFFRTFSQVMLDSKTGAVLGQYDALHAGYRPKLQGVMLALHIGDFGGLPVKIIYCITGLTPGFLTVTGFVMWLKRKRLLAQKAEAHALSRPRVQEHLQSMTGNRI